MAGKAWRAGRRGQPRLQPDGQVRQSQAIAMYGPGAMIDLVDDAVVVGGLDFWHYSSDQEARRAAAITEPRLRDALRVQMEANGRSLRLQDPFMLPPLGDDAEPSRWNGIEVLEFPHWFVCQNQDCRALCRGSELEHSPEGERYFHACPSRKTSPCVPVRFVMACKNGHMEDFPFIPWAHEFQGRPRCAAPSLRLDEGRTGDFSEVVIQCACDAARPISQAFAPQLRIPCSGERPWLGREGREDCTEALRLLVRTASNSYFPQVVSALTIPTRGDALQDAVKDNWRVLQVATPENIAAYRVIPDVKEAVGKFSNEQILAAVADIRAGREPAREPLRTAEFKEIESAPAERPEDLPPPKGRDHEFFARAVTLEGGLPVGVAKVVLVHRLREVRVQIGFSRLESPAPNLQGEFDLGVTTAPLGLQTDWLPASEVRGEGVFVQLDEAAVAAWEKLAAVIVRGQDLRAGFDAWNAARDTKLEFPGVRYYMLHSISHLLMSALALECGYSASAMSERIYCAPAGDRTPMAAILISTGSPGSEGTLGGLVEQGRYIVQHLRHAFDLGQLCANDPVCATHSPEGDLAERYLEGAACHGCLFISENSCERFNRFLDRHLAVPTIQRTGAAFLSKRP